MKHFEVCHLDKLSFITNVVEKVEDYIREEMILKTNNGQKFYYPLDTNGTDIMEYDSIDDLRERYQKATEDFDNGKLKEDEIYHVDWI